MVTEVPYTAIIRDPLRAYHVRYVTLPPGLEHARTELESRLPSDAELVAIVQGNMPVGLPGTQTATTPHHEVPSWPF